MLILRDHLEENAKFLSPTPGIQPPVPEPETNTSGDPASTSNPAPTPNPASTSRTPTQNSKKSSGGSTDVSDAEVKLLDKAWKPVAGWRDVEMVDSLCKALHTYLGERSVTLTGIDEMLLQVCFQPYIDGNRTKPGWLYNNSEADARAMVNEVIQAVSFVMNILGFPIYVLNNYKVPVEGFHSLVDFALMAKKVKMLTEIKAPQVLEKALTKLEGQSMRISTQSGGPSDELVLNKACLYMSSHKVNWLALTSHHKWIFFRLHPSSDKEPEPYISYSSVEMMENNTRPFRALLAMMLATVGEIKVVDSNVDKTVPLPVIEEEEHHSSESSQEDQDKIGSYRGSGPVTKKEYDLRPKPTGPRPTDSPELLVGWTRRKVPDTEWLLFYALDGTKQCSSLGAAPIRLWLQCDVGQGSTGVVYEAKLNIDDDDDNTRTSHSYAVKTVVKRRSGNIKGAVARLFHEFEAYRKIEQARKHGKFGHIAPRCYGMYESRGLYALILDYEGESLDDDDWASLTEKEKSAIYKLISDLHYLGIGHGDLEPRNVVRNSEGSYKIIDFDKWWFHDCPGIKRTKKGSWYRRDIGGQCDELKYLHEMLIGRPVKKEDIPQ
ncbi:hypothetical protein J3R30DRAFT_3684842 [Lentinula aciculospora]|uniref:Protein kinase domain-containing protein n=1 Tax=Lentinula aciculospora TaxID=153920 RepID=A0A9W9A5A7_9AGAR|nr:hypothetical protein J3R30DRAFT_3684842 [Lentinula aciculospora]